VLLGLGRRGPHVRLMFIFGLVCIYALFGGVNLSGFRFLAGDIYIYIPNVQGLVCAFYGWSSCCMGGFMSVFVFDMWGGMCVCLMWMFSFRGLLGKFDCTFW
jgi:hypothetical protein